MSVMKIFINMMKCYEILRNMMKYFRKKPTQSMSWGGLEEDSPASPRLDRLSLKSENESLAGGEGREDTTRSVVISLLAATVQQDTKVSQVQSLTQEWEYVNTSSMI